MYMYMYMYMYSPTPIGKGDHVVTWHKASVGFQQQRARRKRFAPWFASASCVLSNKTTSEVLRYAVLRRACTTMAALSSWYCGVFLHGMRVRCGYWRGTHGGGV
jgi:hypothetical protein